MKASNLKTGMKFTFSMGNRQSDIYKVLQKNPQSLIVTSEKTGKERHMRNIEIPVEVVE